ncbi:MAG: rod shape-determining protein MreC [Desulfovibrio sp.]|nr:rod shape-determining protein MreC [Desulfovibrio sp.]
MTLRRLLILAGLLLVLFLGMYTWNQRTRTMDGIAINFGMEIAGTMLGTIDAIKHSLEEYWDRYFDLVNVRKENEDLRAEVAAIKARLRDNAEDLRELARLRTLLRVPAMAGWRPLGARVLSGRFGPNAVLETVTINRGYVTGGRPGTPLVTQNGLVGRILRASPHAATAFLVTDPGSRVAVLAQQSRANGILVGRGTENTLEVNFVRPDDGLTQGEVLLTSGLDGKYPKGIPVARVLTVERSNYTQFLTIEAEPIVDMRQLEEVLLLEPTGDLQPDGGAAIPHGQGGTQ